MTEIVQAITQVIRRGTRLPLQVERPGWTVSIRFYDVPLFDGQYHISVRLQYRNADSPPKTQPCFP